jgi:hypothetical protein
MKDFFWNIFKKSGSIDAFLAYREYTEKNSKFENKITINKFNGEINE